MPSIPKKLELNIYNNENHFYMNDIMHCMNSIGRKTATYKYGFFKSILDNLFNVDKAENFYYISFDYLKLSFSRIYWNLVVKYKLPQYQRNRRSHMEKVIYDILNSDSYLDKVDFDFLSDKIRTSYLKQTNKEIETYVLYALCTDFKQNIYGYDIAKKHIYFSNESYKFLCDFKDVLEKLNYYAWIQWIEARLERENKTASNISSKLDASPDRSSLERFKLDLLGNGEEPKCFYCGKKLNVNQINLDHFIPWQFVKDDKAWNFVFACRECNSSKSNKIPTKKYLDKLNIRNSHLFEKDYSQNLIKLYNSALHNGFILWKKGDTTMQYYNKHSKEFIDNTINCDMSLQYSMLEKHLALNDTILDIGFGSGRDSLYFSKNYNVYSIDPEESFVIHAKEMGLTNVFNTDVLNMDYIDKFNGIWACASLLHVKEDKLKDAFISCARALKDNGYMYVSFKYGDFCGLRQERYYIDLTEESIKNYLPDNLCIVDYKITSDVRSDREDKWLNVILRKTK